MKHSQWDPLHFGTSKYLYHCLFHNFLTVLKTTDLTVCMVPALPCKTWNKSWTNNRTWRHRPHDANPTLQQDVIDGQAAKYQRSRGWQVVQHGYHAKVISHCQAHKWPYGASMKQGCKALPPNTSRDPNKMNEAPLCHRTDNFISETYRKTMRHTF